MKKFYWDGWDKVPHWECLVVHCQQGLFLSVYVDDIKLAGRKQIFDENSLIWENRHRFLTMHSWSALKRRCTSNEGIVDEYRKMFESPISAGTTDKLLGLERSHANTIAWSYDMEGHAKNAWNDISNWRTKRMPCLDDHQLKKEELETVGELSKVCSQIDLKCRMVLMENQFCSSGRTTLQLLQEVGKTTDENMIRLVKFKDRIIFMSMYNDIEW